MGIRLAHRQLEGGVREALDALAREHEKGNPGVRIKQIPIPERIYSNWLLTQLVGGTAPNIIQIGMGSTDERLARYFLPLTDLAKAPNPHNAGADLDGVTHFQEFLHIEFPLIMTQVRLMLVLMVIGSLQGYGLQFLLLGEDGGPGGRGMVPGLWMFFLP